MADRRPDPEALLARIQMEDGGRRARGRLKVFFGANAGVGKTYAMLSEAHERRREGVDVVVGYVETHGRAETEGLLEGLEVLPRRQVEYRGVRLPEFDLDAALARRPHLVLVDELAHTNAEGSRHCKRWQDVEELLAAGIDVYTTVNVQHLETLNDLVAKITGVVVRETVPDSIFAAADEVELVDIPPEDLLKRLSEGKVYLPEAAGRAAQNFFTRPNLTALRQLALRQTADRVDTQMQMYRRAGAVRETWPVAERILVGVGPAPSSRRLVRATKRMADRLGAEWIALFVETPDSAGWPEADRERVWETLRLAEKLGARTVTVSGGEAAAEVLAVARLHNVSKLVVGKPRAATPRERLLGTKVDRMIRDSGDIDVYVITGDPDEEEPRRRRAGLETEGPRGREYAWAVAAVAACTGLASLLFGRVEQTNVAMVYLLGVVVVAGRFGRWPAVLASVTSVAAFDFFFVPPYLTFAVADTQYLITFAVLLIVALVISTLTTRLKAQGELSRQRERRTAALNDLAAELVRTADADQAMAAGSRHVAEVFARRVTIFRPDVRGMLQPWSEDGTPPPVDAKELGVAQWVFANGRLAGAGTDTLPGARGLYLPLVGSQGTVGVLGVAADEPARLADPERLHFLEAFANQLATAVERANLAEEAMHTRQLEEMDRLKGEFVSNAAHELRTPLTSLGLSVDRLRERVADRLAGNDRHLLEVIADDVGRLRRLASDLLDLSNLEAGRAGLRAEFTDLGGLVRASLASVEVEASAKGVEIECEVPESLPRAYADPVRLGEVLANLLTNALRFTPAAGAILVSADAAGRFVQVSVADSGPGIPLEEQARIFGKYARIGAHAGGGGSGLGLAISREIVRAHGGAIWVDSGPGPGSVFSFTIPIAEPARMGTPTQEGRYEQATHPAGR